MATPTAFEVGRTLWEARVREAWGPYAETIMARNPWPPHETHPDRAAQHDLAIAEARAVLRAYRIETADLKDKG